MIPPGNTPDYVMECVQAFTELRNARMDVAQLGSHEPTHTEEPKEARRAYQRKCDKYYEVARAVIEKSRALLAQINAWTPPTEDHQKFKNFTIQQMRYFIGHGWMITVEVPTRPVVRSKG